MSDDPQDDPGVGEMVELTSRTGRMGLGTEPGLGEIFRVIGRADDFDEVPTLTLTLMADRQWVSSPLSHQRIDSSAVYPAARGNGRIAVVQSLCADHDAARALD